MVLSYLNRFLIELKCSNFCIQNSREIASAPVRLRFKLSYFARPLAHFLRRASPQPHLHRKGASQFVNADAFCR